MLEGRIQALELANQRAATEMGSMNMKIKEDSARLDGVEQKQEESQ